MTNNKQKTNGAKHVFVVSGEVFMRTLVFFFLNHTDWEAGIWKRGCMLGHEPVSVRLLSNMLTVKAYRPVLPRFTYFVYSSFRHGCLSIV